MDALAKWGSVIIVLVNTIFGVVSLVFLVLGCLAKYTADKIDGIADSMIDVIKQKLPEKASEYLYTDNLRVSEFVDGASATFIATGSVLLCIVVWAYCGACCKSRWMLTIYAVILTTIILGELAIVIILTTNRQLIDNAAKESLMKSLKQYKGGRGKNAPSRAWNAAMSLLDCCGVNGVDDFTKIDGWKKQINSSDSIIMDAPFICCVNQSSHCPDHRYNNTNQYNGGCYDAVWYILDSNKSFLIGTGVCCGLFQFLIWFLTVWLVKELGKKQNQVAPT